MASNASNASNATRPSNAPDAPSALNAERWRESIPPDVLGDWPALESRFQTFLEAPIESAEQLEHWLEALSALTAQVSEYGARCSIRYSAHTDDEEAERAYMHWVERIAPRLRDVFFALEKRVVDSPFASRLQDPKYRVLLRDYRAEVDLYREANVARFTEIAKATSRYDKLCGAMLVEYDGRKQTLQQLARYQEQPDRSVRERTYRLAMERRLQDREAFDEIFDELMSLRRAIAAEADCANYRDYAWRSMKRFDYTPGDCQAFDTAIERSATPRVAELDRVRRSALGVERLRPWDLSVDLQSRPPLEPFDPEDTPTWREKTREVFARISPRLGEQFDTLQLGRNLDLESRTGKRPGGYQAALQHSKQPFIFMNAAGSHRDVQVMVHEGGHAFHFMAAADEPIVDLRSPPLEFCEVASMAMELLALDHLDVFYPSQEQLDRARAEQLEGVLRFFPWMATIDEFQHWLYTTDEHTREQRTARWLEIRNRFASDVVDDEGLEPAIQALWHRQVHLFHHPFYYVEYGIAQIGALQVWQNYRRDPQQALEKLLKAFSLGHSVPLPELFETAGARFDFSPQTLEPLLAEVQRELEACLPI